MAEVDANSTQGPVVLFSVQGDELSPQPPAVVSAGNQPVEQRLQNYPQLRGLIVRSGALTADMGVGVETGK